MDLLAHLEAYVAVSEESSFSKAADRLYVAQPVLSRRIKTLERHLGGELFDRTRRQITTTDLGLLLLPHAKDVLSRVDHLRTVAAVVRDSAALTVGVPPDSDPASLARVIHAGSQKGMTIRVQELPAEERANRLADGSLAVALLRMPPESAAHQVPLGLASAAPMNGSSDPRPVHLEDLRPRRGVRGVSPVILVAAEDQTVFAAHRFDKAIARAGLPATRVRGVEATATAVAETLAGHAMLLCTKPFAQRHGLAWAPLADAALHRGYELAPASHRVGNRETPVVLDWLEPLLAAAVGAVGGPSTRRGTAGADSPRPRSTAHG